MHGMRRCEASDTTMGSGPRQPAGPHSAVAAAATFVFEGRPSTGANSSDTGALYETVTVPEDCWLLQPCVENEVSVAPGWLSTANASAWLCASAGSWRAHDWAPARA